MARSRGADDQAPTNPRSADELKASADSDDAVEFGDDEAVAAKLVSLFLRQSRARSGTSSCCCATRATGTAMHDKRRTERNRYIFIIDRRHPDNLRQRALAHDAVFATRNTLPTRST